LQYQDTCQIAIFEYTYLFQWVAAELPGDFEGEKVANNFSILLAETGAKPTSTGFSLICKKFVIQKIVTTISITWQ
jgi:hypothetical protein